MLPISLVFGCIIDAKNVLLGVFVIQTAVFASSTLIEHGQVTTLTTTTTVTTPCSPAAEPLAIPTLTFRINVEYDGSWNATAIGFSNSTANLVFCKCYSGNGNGWIQIAGWNPNGGAILNVTVQKMDASSGNLTPIGNGQVRSTVALYGAVTISLTAVP